jgi:hypothetical protein
MLLSAPFIMVLETMPRVFYADEEGGGVSIAAVVVIVVGAILIVMLCSGILVAVLVVSNVMQKRLEREKERCFGGNSLPGTPASGRMRTSADAVAAWRVTLTLAGESKDGRSNTVGIL